MLDQKDAGRSIEPYRDDVYLAHHAGAGCNKSMGAMMNNDVWYGSGMSLSSLNILILLVILAFAVALFFRQPIYRGKMDEPKQQSAREILDGRFAKGEIDQNEYESRLKTLGS